MLRAHMFRAHRGSLRTRYAHAYESARIFLRPRKRAMTKSLFKINQWTSILGQQGNFEKSRNKKNNMEAK